jgi:hypothetical protein
MGKEGARDDAIDVVVGRHGSAVLELERPPWSNLGVSSGESIQFVRLISIHHCQCMVATDIEKSAVQSTSRVDCNQPQPGKFF